MRTVSTSPSPKAVVVPGGDPGDGHGPKAVVISGGGPPPP